MMELDLIAGIVTVAVGIATLIAYGIAVLVKSGSLWKRLREPKAAAIVMPSPSSIPFPLRRPNYDRTPYAEYIRSRMR